MSSKYGRTKNNLKYNFGRLRKPNRPLWLSEDDQLSAQAFQRDINRWPVLSHAEQLRLARLSQQGDFKAREKLLSSNVRLLITATQDFIGLGLSLLELVSEGMLGMHRALEKFNPDHGVHFTTYAIWWVKHYMFQAVLHQGRLIRLPVNMHVKFRKLARLEQRLLSQNGSATMAELQACSLYTREVIGYWRLHQYPIQSIDQPIGGENRTLADSLVGPDEPNTNPELRQTAISQSWESIQRFQARWSRIKRVPVRNQRLFIQRFGLDGQDPVNLTELGKRYNLTRERTRQIEKYMLRLLYPNRPILPARQIVLQVRVAITTYLQMTNVAQKLDWNV